jgi:hypothetical protein
MRRFFRTIDELLRGRLTKPEDLAEGRIEAPVRQLASVGLVLGCAYGLAMGVYATLRPEHPSVLQLVATTLKVPLLFLLTLAVTYPSLYVVSALFESRLRHAETLRLLLISVCVDLALLASLGPVTAFFTLSTDSYDFMTVLNVAFFAISGFVGLTFLRRALQSVFGVAESRPRAPAIPDAPLGSVVEAPRTTPLHPQRSRELERQSASRRIFTIWVLIYGVVGAQMGWILRPFIGTPEMEFTWFRHRESNFFEAFFRALGKLFT